MILKNSLCINLEKFRWLQPRCGSSMNVLVYWRHINYVPMLCCNTMNENENALNAGKFPSDRMDFRWKLQRSHGHPRHLPRDTSAEYWNPTKIRRKPMELTIHVSALCNGPLVEDLLCMQQSTSKAKSIGRTFMLDKQNVPGALWPVFLRSHGHSLPQHASLYEASLVLMFEYTSTKKQRCHECPRSKSSTNLTTSPR